MKENKPMDQAAVRFKASGILNRSNFPRGIELQTATAALSVHLGSVNPSDIQRVAQFTGELQRTWTPERRSPALPNK